MDQEPTTKRKYRRPVYRPERANRGSWDSVPFDVRLTLSEAAAIIGIDRRSLRSAYAGANPQRQMPTGFSFHMENGRAVFLIRRPAP